MACSGPYISEYIWIDGNGGLRSKTMVSHNDNLPNWNYDGTEPGGNFVRLDIHGDDNKFKGSQKQDSSSINHTATVNIYADNNDVYLRQMQNGNKTFTMTIHNDDNEVAVTQKNNGAHTATITLNGSQPTDLNLTQSGNSTQTYSLSQNCQTAGGCSVTVNQN